MHSPVLPQASGPGAEPQLTAQPTSAGDSAAYERRTVSSDDVVIVSACRTALCKAKRGGFKDTPVDDLIAAVLKDTIRRTGVEPEVGARTKGGGGGRCVLAAARPAGGRGGRGHLCLPPVVDQQHSIGKGGLDGESCGFHHACQPSPPAIGVPLAPPLPPLPCLAPRGLPVLVPAGCGRRVLWQRDGTLQPACQRVPHRNVPGWLPRLSPRAHCQPPVLLGCACWEGNWCLVPAGSRGGLAGLVQLTRGKVCQWRSLHLCTR